ncbi:signal peptidase I [soil metagenome]
MKDPSPSSAETAPSDLAETEDVEGGRSGPLRTLVEWGAVLVGALVVALVVKTFLFQAFYIPSPSMEPTLMENDRVMVAKLSYRLGDVERGDIVVFGRPDGNPDPAVDDLIKRVVGLPGDTIEARDGRVLVNDEVLDESYLPEGSRTDNLPRQTVPDDHLFMMGDNRPNSQDSRIFGPIPEDLVVGRAFVRLWPLDDISGL